MTLKILSILPALIAAASVYADTPNIIFIMADDLGYGDVSCYNPDSKIPPPNMDRLASQGRRFTDAHSPSGVCTPTRYGVLTGRYAWRSRLKSGVLGGYSPPLIEKGRATVASLLKQKGYRTACIGKWHLGLGWQRIDKKKAAGDPKHNASGIDHGEPLTAGPLTLGFDYFFGCSASWDMPPYAWIENDSLIESDLVPTKKKANGFGRAGLKSKKMKPESALPDLTAKAISYIKNTTAEHKDKPFFLYFPLPSPHTPVAPNEGFLGKSKAGKYGDFVFETDWVVGEVMKAIDDAGITADTLLIVTSDNGPERHMIKRKSEFKHFSAAEFRGCKRDNWEGGHRVPFIARWPGRINPATTSDEIICLTDLTATAAAITGIGLPKDCAEDSHNILPALLGTPLTQPIREATVHHSSKGKFAIRQGKWVLLDHPGSGGNRYDAQTGEVQLYDLQTDASEENNVHDQNPEIVSRLKSLLEKYKKSGRSRP
ncbi:MAG: arylsulfatase [Verrucomicrobiales bacterium]|nr:arylsulfatase [Verrucomicrobiales bacterium]